MADECDMTQAREERLQELFARMRRPVVIDLEGNGYCKYCGDTIEFGRWCSQECKEDDGKYNQD